MNEDDILLNANITLKQNHEDVTCLRNEASMLYAEFENLNPRTNYVFEICVLPIGTAEALGNQILAKKSFKTDASGEAFVSTGLHPVSFLPQNPSYVVVTISSNNGDCVTWNYQIC